MSLPPPTASTGASATVAEILNVKGTAVYATTPDATVFDAIKELAARNVGALVVLDHDRLVGMFSERDYTRNVALKGRASKYTPVLDVMSDTVVTVTPETTIAQCMATMTDQRIRHLPVVDQQRLVGLVSIGDLVSYVMSAQREAIEHLEGYITGSYPR
jgi:CBS domain-containing protein